MNNIVLLSKPKGATSEAIRTLRTNLQFTFIDDNVKTIMVTSSMPGEGKSFISSNLAAAFAMVNMKTLIIDCDLRRGTQAKIFDLDKETGLSNLLLDDIKNYKKYINKTEVDNLYVLKSGIVPPNPSEILGSTKNKELLEILKKEYDLIILDCPPIQGLPDALILTSLCDEAIIVSAYKKTPIESLMQTKKSLEVTGIKLAGVVVNQIKRKHSSYYYNEYYK